MSGAQNNLIGAAKRDGTVIAIIALVTFAICVKIDAFDYVVIFSAEHESWELDEILTTLMILPMAISVFAVRRLNDALGELKIRVEAERTANDLALQDPLTQLPNRRAFSNLLIDFAERGRERPFLLVLIDLNRFKAINDLRGHVAGDHLLVAVAGRLAHTASHGATVARLAGDEFVVLIPYVDNDREEERWLEKLSACFEKPFAIGDHQVLVGASMGARRVSEQWHDVDILLSQADAAMYQCKSRRSNSFCVFQPGMEKASHLSASIAEQLRAAVSSRQIAPYYQPLVCLKSGKLLGFEVLARWRLPDGSLRMPNEFIGVAEDYGLIGDLFFNLLKQACHEISTCPDEHAFSVNLSPLQFSDPTLVTDIVGTLASAGIAPSRLEVEITETALVEDIDAAKALIAELHHHGIRIALDDFGTGFSSLKLLSELKIDRIKIDRSFIMDIKTNVRSQTIVRGITSMAHSLELQVTVEGIESLENADWIRALGCDIGQGFLYGRPTDSAVPRQSAADPLAA